MKFITYIKNLFYFYKRLLVFNNTEKQFYKFIHSFLSKSPNKNDDLLICLDLIKKYINRDYEIEEFEKHEKKWGPLKYKIINGEKIFYNFENISEENTLIENEELNRRINSVDRKNFLLKRDIFKLINNNSHKWFNE